MEKDINFLVENNRFNYRVACFITHNGMVLLEKNNHVDFYNLPGGRVKMNESTLNAMKREIKEEMAIDHIEPKLFYVVENFFFWRGENVHELLFIYDVELNQDHPLLQKNTFACEDNKENIFYWTKFDDMQKMKCLPKIIYDLPKMDFNEIKHFSNFKE